MIQVVEGRVILGGEVAREADRLLIAECAARVPNVVGVENQIELGMSSYTYLDARYCGESVADVHLASEVARALGKARVVAQSEIRIQPEFLRPFDLWLDPLYSIGERAADAEAGIGPFATLVSSGLAILVIEGHREVLWRIAEGLEPMLAEDFDRHETSYNSVVFTTGPDGFGPTIGPETDYLFEEAERFELMDSDLSLDELFEDASSSVDTFELPPRPRILVHVRDGLVTLTGSAESEAHRERAAAVAAKVPGVLRVESALTVQSQADYQELLDREIRKHLRMPEMPRPPHSADVDGGPREVRAASFVPIYSDDPDIRTRQLIFVSDGVVAFNPERIAHHSPGSRAERERTLG
ncbi:MAG: BON domain-containing protein, partial [Planctomycetaceae bacterium]